VNEFVRGKTEVDGDTAALVKSQESNVTNEERAESCRRRSWRFVSGGRSSVAVSMKLVVSEQHSGSHSLRIAPTR
jgi:hypothetical protein